MYISVSLKELTLKWSQDEPSAWSVEEKNNSLLVSSLSSQSILILILSISLDPSGTARPPWSPRCSGARVFFRCFFLSPAWRPSNQANGSSSLLSQSIFPLLSSEVEEEARVPPVVMTACAEGLGGDGGLNRQDLAVARVLTCGSGGNDNSIRLNGPGII